MLIATRFQHASKTISSLKALSNYAPQGGAEWTRIEKDSLGPIEVPLDAKWKAQTQRAINNFPISGYVMPKPFLKSLALIKFCAAKANAKAECLDPDLANAIAEIALLLSRDNNMDGLFPVDVFQTGSGTSSNMNMNEVISQLVSEQYGLQVHPNDHVNRSQSSNDVIPTAIAVSAVREVHSHLLPAVTGLVRALDSKAADFKHVYKNGRTHLMDAVPLSLGYEVSAWSAQLQTACAMVLQACAHCEALPIGGTAIGTGLNAPAHFTDYFLETLNKQLGMAFVSCGNKSADIAGQQRAVHLSAALRTVAVALFKMTNDLRWMNSGPLSGLGEISLPKVQPGSSFMPGKANPVLLESALMVCTHVLGTDQIVATAGAAGGNFQLNTMLPLIGFHLLENIRLLGNTCANLAEKAIPHIAAHARHLSSLVARNPAVITALAPTLGYERCAALYGMCVQEQKSLEEVLQRELALSAEQVRHMLQTAWSSHPTLTKN